MKELSTMTAARKRAGSALLALPLLLPLAVVDLMRPVQAAELPLYIDARFGIARTDVSSGALEGDFAKQGIDAGVHSVDGKRHGYAVALGLALTDRLGIEVGYMDLGDVELSFSARSTAIDLATVHPESGNGITAGVRYRHPLTERVSVLGRAGLFAWGGDYDTHRGASQVDDNEESEFDLQWGIGVGYAITQQIGVDLEYQRIEFDRYPTEFVNLGVQWRFGL